MMQLPAVVLGIIIKLIETNRKKKPNTNIITDWLLVGLQIP